MKCNLPKQPKLTKAERRKLRDAFELAYAMALAKEVADKLEISKEEQSNNEQDERRRP